MGVSLENYFSTQPSIQQNTGTNIGAGTNTQISAKATLNMLQNMYANGEMISGKVLSVQGENIELLLSNGQPLSAILGKNVSVNLGEQMMFSIKNMSQNQIELNPMFTNTANTSTIMKALEGASMPVSEQNVTMVQTMMERGMSIQKDALLGMRRTINQFPNAPISDIITLKALKMPVNDTNLTQIAAYKNSENQIMKPITEMLTEIPNTFFKLLESGETGKAVSLYKDLVQLFSEMPKDQMGTLQEPTSPITKLPVEAANFGEIGNMAENPASIMKSENWGENDAIMKEYTQLLTRLGLSEEEIQNVLKENPTKQDLLKVINHQIQENPTMTEEKITDFFRDSLFQKFMEKAGKEVSTLSPEEVAKHDNIETLYEKLYERADKILETLSGKEELALAKSAQNLKANVDFMNQMNQMFQYVQLPLKFSESSANGELYVYGNGKKLSLEDGNVSAFLHLDMEHLGMVDIHVEMNPEKQVKTNFYFEDEAMLDFIYEHIDMLNERLEKRGYGAVTNVQLKEKDSKTPMEEIFEKKEERGILLSTQSFDALV